MPCCAISCSPDPRQPRQFLTSATVGIPLHFAFALIAAPSCITAATAAQA